MPQRFHPRLSLIAASLLLSASVLAAPAPTRADREVTIYNNTDSNIYPLALATGSQEAILVNGQSGVAPNQSASFVIPYDMRDSGRILLFTTNPLSKGILGASSAGWTPATDSAGNSLLTYAGVLTQPATDTPFQLIEYTVETKNGSDIGVIDFDYSGVDHLTLPVAVEGVDRYGRSAMGYTGSTMTMTEMQAKLHAFSQGDDTLGYFSQDSSQKIGWPYYAIPASASKSTATLKIPGSYNIYAQSGATSYLYPGIGNNMLVTDVNGQPHTGSTGSVNALVMHAITSRWLGWVRGYHGAVPADAVVQPGYYADHCNNDDFCNAFATTAQAVWDKAAATVYPGQAIQNYDQAGQVVASLLGFTEKDYGDFSGPYANAFKALMRGVPSLDPSYQARWYPEPGASNPDQKYNLDPFVWFVHKQLNFTNGYGFSIDDDVGNMEVPASGLVIAVGGAQGLPNGHPYQPATQQAINIGGNAEKHWDYLDSLDGLLGDCQIGSNGSASCPVTLGGAGQAQSLKLVLGVKSSDPSKPASTLALTIDSTPSGLQKGACVVDSPDGRLTSDLCQRIEPQQGGARIVAIPAPSAPTPTPPPGEQGGRLNLAPGWNAVSSSDCPVAALSDDGLPSNHLQGKPVAISFSIPSGQATCSLSLQGGRGQHS